MCSTTRARALTIGWIHLIITLIITVLLSIYLCTYNNEIHVKTLIDNGYDIYEENIIEAENVGGIGLTTSICLLLLCVAFLIFDILLLSGIMQESHILMKPFVYANVLALCLQICITIYIVFEDLLETNILKHFAFNFFVVLLLLLIFKPIYQIYGQIRNANEGKTPQGVQNIESNPEQQRLTEVQPQTKYMNEAPQGLQSTESNAAVKQNSADFQTQGTDVNGRGLPNAENNTAVDQKLTEVQNQGPNGN
uniref:Uncharacterized protein n=1 Tax=Stomoxys calcitrans TaxID=35570 RepID=A0A1I8NV23_STOCA